MKTTQKLPQAAAIYARISSDRAGEALGVKRQLADCHAEAERRGWEVAEDYVDNDVSAHSGRVRPEYRRLLADIETGHVDAVIVYDLDRLHRRPKELEEFVEVCDRAGIDHLVTVHGDHNIGTGDGLFVARILAAMAAQESDKKSQRLRRKAIELAESGQPNGGSARPFGYEPDRITLRTNEAEIVRDLAHRFLAGESLASLTRWLNDNDVPTPGGSGAWRTPTLRGILYSARISGQREHRGEVVANAVWPAIITPEETSRIRAILDDPSRRVSRTARRYLLAGMLRCEACGAVLMSHPRKQTRRYVCKTGVDFVGCGAISIVADPLEQLIAEAVLMRLDSPATEAALAGRQHDTADATVVAEGVATEQAKLEELSTMWANNEITQLEWKAARKPIEARLKRAKQRLARLQQHSALDGLAGKGEELRRQWSTLNLDRQRAIVQAVLDHAVIRPATSYRFDPARVVAVWKL